VFRVRGLDVCLPTLTTWGLAVRKSRIQGHRSVTQLNQLASQFTWHYGVESRAKVNKQHSHIPPPSDCQDERGSCVLPRKTALSVDPFGRLLASNRANDDDRSSASHASALTVEGKTDL